jgi:dienelactone hydrolase
MPLPQTPPSRVVLTLVLIVVTTAYLEAAEPSALDHLKDYLATDAADRPPLDEQAFSTMPLTRVDAEAARELFIADWRERLHAERRAELDSGEITIGEHTMPIFYKTFGEKPEGGRSLFISMHGGGNAPPRVNDRQWRNQQGLYEPEEGVYVAPRAPTNTWNLWHEAHIDDLFDRLIEDMVLCEDVNPNRVYIMGYSAGGDGVYQLAPRMADRLAAAAMMAGHPNETSPLGLRNLPFALQVGELDDPYDRNKVASEWGEKLAALREQDPEGYEHYFELHAGKGHWMDRDDAKALPWMARFTRNPWPKRVVWKQDDVTHTRFYWLGVPAEHAEAGDEIVATVEGQHVRIETDDVPEVLVLLNDELVNLDEPVIISHGEKEVLRGVVSRTIGALAKSLNERGDTDLMFAAEQLVKVVD